MAEQTADQKAAEAAQKVGLEKAAEAIKAGEAPKTVEEAAFHVLFYKTEAERIGGKLKETTEESIKRKEKLRAIEQEKADKDAASLKEKGEFQKLVETLEPQAKRAAELEKALQGYFDLEVADVPEEKRNLIPDGAIESKLTWLKNAKAQGIFGAPKKKPEDTDDKKRGDTTSAEFLSWLPTDSRLTTLTPEDYARWKKHNGRDGNRSGGAPAAWGAHRA